MAYTRWDTRLGVEVVQNCNGDLVATANCQASPSMRILPGSWRQQTCDFARFDGSVMVAYCYAGGDSREIRFDKASGAGRLDLCNGQLALAGTCGGGKPGLTPSQPRPQPQPQPQPQQPVTEVRFPSGSWQGSCRNPRWEDRVLVATCQTSRGSWVYASFDTNRAFYTLSNCDGVLVGAAACPSTPQTGQPVRPAPSVNPVNPAPRPQPTAPAQTRLPGGNWTEHCRDGRIQGETLVAECRTPGAWVRSGTRYIWQEGSWRPFQRSLRGYNGPMAFCDGDLVRRADCS